MSDALSPSLRRHYWSGTQFGDEGIPPLTFHPDGAGAAGSIEFVRAVFRGSTCADAFSEHVKSHKRQLP